MVGRLDQIDSLLRARLGAALVDRCPDLKYSVNHVLVRLGYTAEPLCALLDQLDSLLFNAVFAATGRSMVVGLPGGGRMRITEESLRDLADRLLALAYRARPVTPALADALFDFARDGSFAAMRELVARYPLDEQERACYLRVLDENGQME